MNRFSVSMGGQAHCSHNRGGKLRDEFEELEMSANALAYASDVLAKHIT